MAERIKFMDTPIKQESLAYMTNNTLGRGRNVCF